MASLLVCIAPVALYALAETKRRNRNIDTRANQINSRDAL